MDNLPPLSTLFGYSKAIIRPTPEYLSLFYNHISKKESTDRLDTSYETNNFWSLFYYYFTYPIEILPNLYLGNIINSANFEQLKELNITTIFNVTDEHGCYFENYFNYHKVSIKDDKNVDLPQSFHNAVDNLYTALNSGERVLVHCHHGRSRSVALITAYLMKYKKTLCPTFEIAYETIKRKKPIINMNVDFVTQIKKEY